MTAFSPLYVANPPDVVLQSAFRNIVGFPKRRQILDTIFFWAGL